MSRDDPGNQSADTKMNTIIEHIDPNNPDPEVIARAGDIIKKGGLVAFPTETVYGLGGDALNPEASAGIYAAKGRPSDNPLIVHIAETDSLDRIVRRIPDGAGKLADRFWPGPLTIIFEKSDAVPVQTTGGLDTVAVRFPEDRTAQALIKASGGYIAAPSANISGRPSPTRGEYVIQDQDGRVDMIICGDDSRIGLESTIVDMTSEEPVILRPGFITLEELGEVLPGITLDRGLISEDPDIRPKAPGMKYRHYAPRGELTIVEGDNESVISYINMKTGEASEKGLRTGVIAHDERTGMYKADLIAGIGRETEPEEAAHRIYTVLRRMDDEKIDVIYTESMSEGGIGTAFMNRLTKAAGHHIVRL